MIPWTLIDTARIPGGAEELRLKRRGGEFSIMLGANELMNNRLSGSEEALATLAAKKIAGRAAAHVLIGGLGMGFTLRAALGAFQPDARIIVAELVPQVVAWARGSMAEVFGDSLDDARASVEVADVGRLIGAARGAYDAILLDVDNGPEGLTRRSNDSLYSPAGLAAARAALRPGGVLSVWSCAPDRGFTQRLGRAGFDVEETSVRAGRAGRGARHVLWLATRGA